MNGSPTVAVRFRAAEGKGNYAIRAVGSDQQCALPCTLNLAPGLRKVKVSGDGSGTEEIIVSNTGGDFEVSPGGISKQFYWGLGTGAVGAVLLTAGLIEFASRWNCGPLMVYYTNNSPDPNSPWGQCMQQHGQPLDANYPQRDDKSGTWIPLATAGGAALVTGGILMLTGYSGLQVKPSSGTSASNATSSFPIPRFSLGFGNGNVSMVASGSF